MKNVSPGSSLFLDPVESNRHACQPQAALPRCQRTVFSTLPALMYTLLSVCRNNGQKEHARKIDKGEGDTATVLSETDRRLGGVYVATWRFPSEVVIMGCGRHCSLPLTRVVDKSMLKGTVLALAKRADALQCAGPTGSCPLRWCRWQARGRPLVSAASAQQPAKDWGQQGVSVSQDAYLCSKKMGVEIVYMHVARDWAPRAHALVYVSCGVWFPAGETRARTNQRTPPLEVLHVIPVPQLPAGGVPRAA